MLRYLKLIFMIILFIWISFFAPLAGYYWQNWQTIFLVFLILSLIILVCINKEDFKRIFDKKDISFWIFLLTMLSGIINVKQPPLAYHHFWYAVFPIPFVFLFAKVNFEERQGIVLMRSLCLIASLVSIYGILEFITKRNFIYINYLNNFYYLSFKGRRMMSTHIHPTPLATYLIGVFPLAQGLVFKEKNAVLKSAAVVCAGIISIGIILTFSRGALLGALAAAAVMVFFLLRQKKIFISALVLLGAVIGVSSLLSYWGYFPFYRYSFTGLLQKFVYTSKIDRFIMTLQILKEHPFLGVGFGHFRVLFDNYLPHLANVCGYDTKVADCMYLTILAETGLIGFTGFALFIFSLLKQAGLKLKLMAENKDKILPVCFLSGFVAIMCAFLTYDGLYWIAPSYLFWSYAGILAKQRKS
ncbi:MAG: O-antigen ligase family protein [Candidatus Omnitrophota bacterium]